MVSRPLLICGTKHPSCRTQWAKYRLVGGADNFIPVGERSEAFSRLLIEQISITQAATTGGEAEMRTKPLSIVALMIATHAFAACSTPTARKDQSSPYYAVPEGSVLQLNRTIEVPRGTTRIWIQRGRVVGNYDHYWPSCSFEVRTLDRDKIQVIESGQFTVTRHQFLRDEFAGSSQPLLVASLRLAAARNGNGHSMIFEGWHLWLNNPDQPNVKRLTCRGAFGNPAEVAPPSIDEIRAALGEVVTLQLRKRAEPGA